MDRFSPCVLASVRTLVLPVGHIARQRFHNFLGRLQKEAWKVNLADTERYVGDDDILLSSKSFTNGSIFFNYTTSALSQQQEQLSPFELFREPLLVLGVVEGQGNQDGLDQKELGVGVLRERYPRVVYRQLLVLEDGNVESREEDNGAICIANAGDEGSSALGDGVCRITTRFLKELSTYTRAMQASPSVQTPGQTARKLQRANSQRDRENRPSSSGHSTPTQSMDLSSPVDRDGSTKAPPLDRASPATSFDQIPGANKSASNISRSDSRASSKGKQNRSSSQDRVPLQGFGSGTSQDKLKQRGKARVGIVIGSIYMAAGQWSEALKILTEHTSKARILSDHIWHAKGLENIIVCLLLHSWAGLEFQIPSVCYPATDKSSGQQRFSVNLPSDFKITDAAQLASVRRLSTSLPDLLKFVVSLYRSVEGSLELPYICIGEATIRFCKLLAILHKAGGELEPPVLDELLGSNTQPATSSAKSAPEPASFSKAAIAEMLASAHPASEDPLQASEQVIILSGMASVYALLRMERKRANVLKDLVVRLTTALTQARKRGAAEAGIHPAASISAEAGADGILALSEESEGINSMVAAIVRVYGALLPIQKAEQVPTQGERGFGSDLLKLSILNQIVALYEAAPDPHGLTQATSAILLAFGVNGAVDVAESRYSGILSKDNQARLNTNLTRTVGISRLLGLSNVETTYWDRYLVRGVEFVLPDLNLRVVGRESAKSRPATATSAPSGTGGNPLLYDPNANRPGTGPSSSETAVLTADEPAVCLVTLQNPYDIAVDIESLNLVTDDLELRGSLAPFTLQPMRLQQMPLTVYPSAAGDCKIEHVQVKIGGCSEESFPIVNKAWAPETSRLVKDIGQRDGEVQASEQSHLSKAEHAVVSLKIVEPQPLLVFEKPALQNSSMMLLDGENHSVTIGVRNASNMALSIFDVLKTQMLKGRPTSSLEKGSSSISESVPMKEEVLIEPGQSQNFEFALKGRADVAQIQFAFMYGTAREETQHARVLRMAIDLTVNAALQAQHFTFQPAGEDENFMLSFDLRNAWPRPLEYSVMGKVGTLHPGQIERMNQVLPALPPNVHAENSPESLAKTLQERLSINWSCDGRTGDLDLSGLALSNEEVGVVSRAPVTLSLSLTSASRPLPAVSGDSEQVVRAGSFVNLTIKVSGGPSVTEPLLLLLRIHPHDSSDGDSTTRPGAVVNGAAHRIFRPAGEEQSVDFSLCAVLAGKVELEVTASSAKASSKTALLARRTIGMIIV